MKIASFSIADYCEATEGMPHDVERLYFRMLMKMLSREGGLPDDDRENARMFGYDVRSYRPLKAKLLAWPEAIFIDDGHIKNKRVENDLREYRERRKQAAKSGEIGGRSKRDRPIDRPEIDRRSVSKSVEIAHTTHGDINDLAQASPSPTPTPKKEKRSRVPKGTLVADATADRPKDLDALEAFKAYNELALRLGLSQASTLTPARRKSIKARLREHGGMTAWQTALANVEKSAFLQGRNDNGWAASLDFIIRPTKFPKLLEGGYGNGAHAPPPVSRTMQALNRRIEAQKAEAAHA